MLPIMPHRLTHAIEDTFWVKPHRARLRLSQGGNVQNADKNIFVRLKAGSMEADATNVEEHVPMRLSSKKSGK